ncbi:hypothetical protein A9Q83_06895 [Alphaproteobacteria bacterium 46_93_T64]|nr:hypothetical protein A9Q83_06895 [Alphaproteobacteria bacterium 46_93_T64]
MQDIQRVLDFWFRAEDHPDYGKPRPEWFKKDSKFDDTIKQQFLFLFVKAKEGQLLYWTESKNGCLALILLFDQFSRNMFRDTPDAFATDGKALEIARLMISSGFFDELASFQKTFAALPFEHSESLQDQKKSMELFKDFGDENAVNYAERHFDIVEKFGRFPHRNDILGRHSTDDEIAFLSQPNSSF